MINFEDDIEDDYDVLDHGIFSEAEEDNDVEKPAKKSGGEEDGEEHEDGKKKKKVAKPGAQRRVTSNPKPKLNADRLCGPRGIIAVQETFKNVKLKGKSHEKADLDIILSKMEHWAHRLFPQLKFDDCVEQVAKVGSNRAVQVYLKRFRSDMLDNATADIEEPIDLNEFPRSPPQQSGEQLFNQLMSNMCNTSTSSVLISQEQQERMAENKRRAEEKRKSRLLNASQQLDNSTSETNTSLVQQEPIATSVNSPKATNNQNYLVPDENRDVELIDMDDNSLSEVRNSSNPAKQVKDGDDDIVAIDDMLDDLS